MTTPVTLRGKFSVLWHYFMLSCMLYLCVYYLYVLLCVWLLGLSSRRICSLSPQSGQLSAKFLECAAYWNVCRKTFPLALLFLIYLFEQRFDFNLYNFRYISRNFFKQKMLFNQNFLKRMQKNMYLKIFRIYEKLALKTIQKYFLNVK